MEITEEKLGNQNALLKIKINPEDYTDKYDTALKQYRKQISMPGFRPGKVPMGVVKKKYGKSLLAEELNKMLNSSIQSYITENELQVLGSPIPSEEHDDKGDWDNPSDFEFTYEMGLAPDLKTEISNKDKFDYYTIKIDDKMLDKHVKEIAKRYGKLIDADVVKENELLVGDFVELDSSDEVKEAGIMNQSTISLESMDKSIQKKFKGKKIGDFVVVDPHKVSGNHEDLAKMLGISHDEVHNIDTNFRFIIREIKEMEPAELNQEFFDKVFGEGNVNSEEEFKDKIREELKGNFSQDSDRLFKRDLTNKLIEKYKPTLPDDFLKRWIQLTNEKPISAEEIENDYTEYKKGLQWQLIFNDLIKQNDIKVEQEEIIDRTKGMLKAQYAQYGLPAPEDQELNESAMKVLTNQDESRKIYDMIYDEKLMEHIKSVATIKEKEVDYDKFVELASKG